jgi:CheY-like chemotaxis protein
MAYSILLVEDDPHFGKQLVDLFRFLGYRTLLATSGEDALTAFDKEPSSFVLCDIMLPGMGGVEVIEKLRTFKTGGSVPVMLMSAVYKNPRLFQRDLRRLNVLEFLPKPFSVIDVGRKVSTVLDEATEVGNPEADITESGSWRAEEIREALGDAPPKFESIGTCDRVKRLTLFIEIFRGHSAGQLRLRKGRVSRVVYFLNGYPVWAESDDPADELGNLLVKERLAGAEPVETARARATRRGITFREALLQGGIIGERRLFLVERKRVRQIVVGAFAWSTADYEFEAGDDFVDRIGIFEVNPVRCLGEAVRRYGAVNDLAPEIYPRTSQILVRGTQFRRLFPYLDLPPALKGLGPDMQAEKTVGDLFKKYARESQDLIKLLWLMFRLGISDTTEAPPEAPTQLVPPKSKKPGPDPASAPIETNGVPTEDGLSPRARAILQDYLSLLGSNHYAILGVPKDAERGAIDRGYQERLARYRLSTLGRDVATEIRSKAKELLVRTVDAYETLAEPSKRLAYDKLASGEHMAIGLAAAPGSDLLAKAAAMVETSRWADALPLYRELRNRHPSSPETLAHLGRCVYKTNSGDDSKAEARELFAAALDANPYHRTTHRFLADFCREEGDDAGYRAAVAALRNIGTEESWVAGTGEVDASDI